jgi:hypothetical protein
MRFVATRFRPTFGRVLTIATALIVAAGIGGLVVSGDLNAIVRYAWPLLLVAALAVALFWLPSLYVSESEIVVRNVFSTVHVPWDAIQRIDTKYALTLYTASSRVSVWASPAPNRYAAELSVRKDATLPGRVEGGAIRPGDLLNTESGAAAYVIRTHWNELLEDGHIGDSTSVPLVREPHLITIVVLGVLVVASVLGALL